jgi:succinyl-diaminopimelate desuccinylase
MNDPTLELTRELIERRSVTPEDAGCQQLLAGRLQSAGFDVEHLRFGDVDNLWAQRGTDDPLLVFAGHTDVVPPGPLEDWNSDPFTAVVRDGRLYGRGAADMKSSLAAFVTAIEKFTAAVPHHKGSIGVLITSDEEGVAINGTAKVVEWLRARSTQITYCIVGEPSSSTVIGDTVKNGRRGSITGRIIIPGIQGHVAYPDLADNPVPRSASVLTALSGIQWDSGNTHFPATNLQISNLTAGTGATNVIPGEVVIDFSVRYSTETDADDIQSNVGRALDKLKVPYEITWHPCGKPFLTGAGDLIATTLAAILEETGRIAELSTSGGTSDGRFIAPAGAEVVELGPVNSSIHKVNEFVDLTALEVLPAIYLRILEKLLGG